MYSISNKKKEIILLVCSCSKVNLVQSVWIWLICYDTILLGVFYSFWVAKLFQKNGCQSSKLFSYYQTLSSPQVLSVPASGLFLFKKSLNNSETIRAYFS